MWVDKSNPPPYPPPNPPPPYFTFYYYYYYFITIIDKEIGYIQGRIYEVEGWRVWRIVL